MQQKGRSHDKFHQKQCVIYSSWISSLLELVAELKTIKSHALRHKLLQASGMNPLSLLCGTIRLISNVSNKKAISNS